MNGYLPVALPDLRSSVLFLDWSVKYSRYRAKEEAPTSLSSQLRVDSRGLYLLTAIIYITVKSKGVKREPTW